MSLAKVRLVTSLLLVDSRQSLLDPSQRVIPHGRPSPDQNSGVDRV